MEIAERLLEGSGIPYHITKNNTRLGVIQNFAKAFSNCDADFIAYCDQDDVWHHEKISVCREWCSRDGVSMVFHRSLLTDQDLNSNGVMHPYGFSSGVYPSPHVPIKIWGYGHQYIFSRSVRDFYLNLLSNQMDANGIFGNMDKSIMWVSGVLGSIVYLDQDLVKFRRHDRSVSNAGKIVDYPFSTSAPRHYLTGRFGVMVSREVRDLKFTLQNLDAMNKAIRGVKISGGELVASGYSDWSDRISRILMYRLELYERKRGMGIFLFFRVFRMGGVWFYQKK